MRKQLSFLKNGLAITFVTLFLANSVLAQQYDMYVFDIKTGLVRQVTNIPNSGAFNATWSNNNQKIAHDVVGGPAPYGNSIYVTDVITGESILLAGAEGGNDAAWSPDGVEISFDAWEFNYDYWTWMNNLYMVPANGGSRRFLRLHSNHASWSPNKNRLAFADNWFGYIGTMGINGGNETFVAYGNWPSWSPNGQYIAFNGQAGGVWVIKVDSSGIPQGAPNQLTTTGYGPTWSVNNKSIVYIDWPNGDPDLYSVSITGGIPERVTGRIGGFDMGDYDPAFSNNGQFIAYSSFTDPGVTKAAINKKSLVTEESSIFKLDQNYPNPFSAETKIGFRITKQTHVVLNIYNISGQKIKSLVDADYQPGYYHVTWNGKDSKGQIVASGVYLSQIQAGHSVQTRMMNLMR